LIVGIFSLLWKTVPGFGNSCDLLLVIILLFLYLALQFLAVCQYNKFLCYVYVVAFSSFTLLVGRHEEHPACN